MSAEPVIGMIWAQTPDGVIGRDGTMPWDVPEDMAHFKATTAGHPVIMGRRTWESFPEQFRPLPGRTNIVISTRPDQRRALTEAGAVAAASLEEALEEASSRAKRAQIWVLGGGRIFEAMLHRAHTAAVTIIDVDEAGDTYAPVLEEGWTRTSCVPDQGWDQSRKGARYRMETWKRSGS